MFRPRQFRVAVLGLAGLVPALILAVLSFGGLAFGGPVVSFKFDENGNGFGSGPGGTVNLLGALAFDPGPGGLASAMTYSGLGNPPSLVAGDVLLFEPGTGNTLSDVVRFNPAGTGGNPAYRPSLVFYSDTADTGELVNVADTGFPIAFYANTVNIREIVTSDGIEEAIYTPLAGQPGFVAGFSVTYNLVSDAPVPSTFVMACIGAVGLTGYAWRRRGKKRAAA